MKRSSDGDSSIVALRCWTYVPEANMKNTARLDIVMGETLKKKRRKGGSSGSECDGDHDGGTAAASAARRFSEKRRKVSTCKFADRIAKRSVETFETYAEKYKLDRKNRTCQTVVASVCAHFKKSGKIQVLSMGMGTKCVDGGFDLKRELDVVRDMHAEVLAKRGFQRFLMQEIVRAEERHGREKERGGDISSTSAATFSNRQDELDGGHNETAVLERSPSSDAIYRMRPDVTLHLWTSSVPCGNAAIRRWAKGSKKMTFDGLDENELPSQPHDPISLHAIKEGQVAVLVKTEMRFRAPDAAARAGYVIPRSTKAKFRMREGESQWIDSKRRRSYGPRGTSCAPTWSKTGTIASCSDKICKWNALGIQGSACVGLVRPMFLSSVTIGRKFSLQHCRRALCCRLGNFPGLRHPVLMGTVVPLDDESMTVSNDTTEGRDGGANFSDFRALAWVRGDSCAVLIDGKTGRGGRSTKRYFRSARSAILHSLNAPGRDAASRGLRSYDTQKRVLQTNRKYFSDWVRGCCESADPSG
eukprot:g1694.t1